MASASSKAKKAVAPGFKAAGAGITAEQAAAQTLYNTLIGGLRGSAEQSQAGLLEGAQRRGVEQVSTGRNIAAGINPAMQQGEAQIGSNQSNIISALMQAQGQLGQARTQATQQRTNTILGGQQQASQARQRLSVTNQQAALQKKQDVFGYNQSVQQADRSFSLAKQQNAISQARAAAQRQARSNANGYTGAIAGSLSQGIPRNEGGGYETGDLDLWQTVKESGGDERDLILLLQKGDANDQIVADSYINRVNYSMKKEGANLKEAQKIGWNYVKQARPTAFYKSKGK